MGDIRIFGVGRGGRGLAAAMWIVAGGLLAGAVDDAAARAAEPLELKKGDHICLIGNTLAERMQHSGWMETYLHAHFPEHNLVFRNLGYSADEVELSKRLRSMDFGSPDQWLAGNAPVPQPNKLSKKDDVNPNRFALTNTKADVIFAFFGYNESYAGEPGLPKFKADLEALLKHMLAQKYNGKSAPRIVLFSPTAFENLKDKNLPEGTAQNARLKLYADAMAEVATATGVGYVDLLGPTQKAFNATDEAFTINGLHLNDKGDEVVGRTIATSLFGPIPQASPNTYFDILRAAVNDKNFHWYHRYRTTDGYSTYGERAFLKFSEGPGGYGDGRSNYGTVQRELEVLDVMTSNRDKAVWAAAQGTILKVDDKDTPSFFEVISNKPGPLPGGKHVFLGGEEAIKSMTVHKDMQVNLYASEVQFPELINPVQMAVDTKGRIWVAAWPTYPHWKPKAEEMNDKLLILEDTNGDGKADKCKTFADKLHNPTGFEFWNGGVLVSMPPDILFLKDTDGDDKADVRTRVLHGLDTADTHHAANSFTLDPGGALYFQEGTFHHTQVETPWGPPKRVANGAVFRFEPRSYRFDIYVSHGFANPHGHAFDKWGQDIVVDGTGANPYHAALFSGHIEHPAKHNRPPQVYQQRTRPCPGIEYLSSSHFPEEYRGRLLVGNVIGVQGILQYKVFDKDASFGAEEDPEPIVLSSDPSFRPADLEVGADGAIYFTDWQNPIIGHMQHNLRDPNRDKIHGRVYRITHKGRPLATPAKIAGEPIEKLLDLLKHPDDRVRYRTRIELSGRNTDDVMAALAKWSDGLDKAAPNHEHDVLESLWLHQNHNVVNPSLLERVLKSPDFHARAAAVRVLCYWRDRISNALDLLKVAAADSAPRVRLEAVRAASFFPQAEAAEIVIIAGDLPTDQYLDFVSKETMRTLDPIVKAATDKGERIAFTTDAGQRYYLKGMSTENLLKEKRTRSVFLEMLLRPGLQDEHRKEAVLGLSRLDKKPELRVIMDAIRDLDAKQANADVTLVFDLVRLLTGRTASELETARAELEKLATSAKQPVFRQIGFVSLINVDRKVDPAWTLATSSAGRLQDFLNAMPLIADASVRASLYDRIEPLLKGLPANLASGSAKGTTGRFVRIELPRAGTLTLAEVEVFSGGQNVAPRGKASQKNTAHGGDAKRAIDGKTSGDYGAGTSTHTEENTNNAWWEVDLGEETPIDQIVVHNRTDGDLGKRLDNFTLRVLDSQRADVHKQTGIKAPEKFVAVTLEGGGPEAQVRRAAMVALTQVRGQEPKTFQSLAKFVVPPSGGTDNSGDRLAAVRALQRLPRAAWPKDDATKLVPVLVEHVRKIPVADRTSPAALDMLEFADALTTLLPVDDAKKARAVLRELGVRVIRVGTVFEKMSYDKETLVVQAGKPVEFVLDNTDLMPHNFVIGQPGSLEEIGMASEANAQQPAFIARQYVPDTPKILLSSRLLFPRESQKLSFTAPTKPGVYPYVCTYPGHWRRMHGALYVVADLDEYLAKPEEYLTLHPVETKDPLLKDRRPRTEWKFEELTAALADLGKGQTYGNGQQMFKVAACVGCHKMDGQGREFGPDLTKLDAKLTPAEILKEMFEPSAKINEKYQSNVFTLFSGKVITGLVIEESGDLIKVVENPLVAAEPTVIKRGDVEERVRSKTSIMPKGLLDKLTREEILELIAYVTARGDKKAAVFGGDGHGHP